MPRRESLSDSTVDDHEGRGMTLPAHTDYWSNRRIAELEAEVQRLREEVREACSGLGLAIPLMTSEQIATWMTRMRRVYEEASSDAPR